MASIGSMRTTIDLIAPVTVRDKAGFTTLHAMRFGRLCGRMWRPGTPRRRG
ncbi:hypothetical protein [Corynebacterium silvaticum]|uniref:Uncharacterized protein n=1 Tax=Corynebacterium silvaticum TaxID=2320431 RepID=A0ACD4PZ56_9CORY|nr:hypothetical protein [Corynebacterium silvaticum]WCV10745.1 hypothetical protein CBE74_12315 [Corynebacterium silvaticum]